MMSASMNIRTVAFSVPSSSMAMSSKSNVYRRSSPALGIAHVCRGEKDSSSDEEVAR